MAEVLNFLHMGGYAWFVWPSFAITFLVLFLNVWISRMQFKRILKQTARRAAAKALKNSNDAKT